MDNLLGSLSHYGLVEGLSLYIKLKSRQIDSISTSKLPHTVYMRPGSTDRCVFKQIFLKQDFNIPILNAFTPKTILDLGANIGMSSLYFANRFPDAKIIGVEPDEDNGRMFAKNLEHFPNVKFELAAVRGDNKKVIMDDHGKGESGYMAEESEEGLPALTIADVMDKYNLEQIDLIKMDIEGSEKSVFEANYDRWLPHVKVLFVELHERKAPGCTAAMENAIKNHSFTQQNSGEYHVLINNDLINS